MTLVKLKHVDRFKDRHGQVRYYFRRGHGPRIVLEGKPCSAAFMESYNRAMAGDPVERVERKRGEPGTFDRLVQEYYQSPEYLKNAKSTQRQYRGWIEKLLLDEKLGPRLVHQMTRTHVRKIIGKRSSETPGAANNTLAILKILMGFAIDNDWRSDNPALRIRRFELGEHYSWTEEEIEIYENYWKIGSKERIAFDLLLYTGQRVSDVSGMSWTDFEGNLVQVVQEKTGAKLWIRVHPLLAKSVACWPKRHVVLVPSSRNQKFKTGGLSSFMARKIERAGLPERCVAHGLRKAAARRLAEAGCSANEIASVTGHASLAEVQRYTKAAEQKRLAIAAMGRLGNKG
jgi:enterobacteria phage integrase